MRPAAPDEAVSLDEALALLLAGTPPLGSERVRLEDALGRTLAEEVRSTAALPGFDQAAMDGFAVCSADVAAASESAPLPLRVIGASLAGDAFEAFVERGEAVRVMTGAALPRGTDTVVPFEEADGGDRASEIVRIRKGGQPFRHVRRMGEDLPMGALALAPGIRIGPAEVALLAGVGHASLACAREPRVAVLSSGDELLRSDPRPGRLPVRDANGPALRAAAREAGAALGTLGVVPDDAAAIAARLRREAEAGADVLILSGGAARTGDRDCAADAAAALGARPLFREVRLKPGKALGAYVIGSKRLLFTLPGNPAAALVGFWALVRPALRAMQGDPAPSLPEVLVPASADHVERPGRVHLARVRLAPATAPGTGYVVLERLPDGAAMLHALSRANALLRLEGSVRAGEPVRAMLLRGVSSSA